MFNPFKQETYEQRVIRFADIMVQQTDYTGKINKYCLSPFPVVDDDHPLPEALLKIRKELNSLQPIIDGDLEPYKKWMTKNFDDVKNHLLSFEYIDKPQPDTQEWILNETGKKMKQLKGHNKYQSYLDKKLKAEIAEMNGKIHWLRRAIIAGIIGFIVGLSTNYLKAKQEQQKDTPKESPKQQQVSQPSNPPKNLANPVKNVP